MDVDVPSSTAAVMLPPEDRQDLLLLRLGGRTTAATATADHDYTVYGGRSSRPLLGVRKHNGRGTPLEYAPYSYRCGVEHVPRWILHCRSVSQDRRGRQKMDEREQYFVAMGYFALLVMRRWRKWARREAGLRRLIDTLSVRAAVRRWKEVARLLVLLPLLQRLAVRKAWLAWKLRVEEHDKLQAADAHRSRSLLSKAWETWSIHRASMTSHRTLLRYALHHWRSWQRRRRTRVEILDHLITKRTAASAFCRWRRLVSAASISAEHTRLHREEALRRVLRSLLLHKYLRALGDYASTRRTLSRLLNSLRARALQCGVGTWRRWLLQQQQNERNITPPHTINSNSTVSRRQPGKPRKGHCRCVYDVSRGQRCNCAPRSHLLRRVEELHRLVAQGLDRRDGGHRLLSHVVQGSAASAGVSSNRRNDDAAPVCGGGGTRTFGYTSRPGPTASGSGAARRGLRHAGSALRVGSGAGMRSEEDTCEQRTSAVVVRGVVPTAAATDYDQATGGPPQSVHAFSLEAKVGASAGIALTVPGRVRSSGGRTFEARPRRARAAPPRRDMTRW